MGKKALIIGITGQDGSYLAGLLLSKGYWKARMLFISPFQYMGRPAFES